MKRIYLIRHGETAWSKSGQHTGLTDIPLTERGTAQAKKLAARLSPHPFDHVFTSPLQRAKHTCEICGHEKADALKELAEWNYGDYEGKTSQEIALQNPDWLLFRDGAPNGEGVQDVEARVKNLFKILEPLKGDIALFTSGHISRAIACIWIGQPLELGNHLYFSTGGISLLGYHRKKPVIMCWNDTHHLDGQ